MLENFGFLSTNKALMKFKTTIISITAYFFPFFPVFSPFPMMVLCEFKTVQITREMISPLLCFEEVNLSPPQGINFVNDCVFLRYSCSSSENWLLYLILASAIVFFLSCMFCLADQLQNIFCPLVQCFIFFGCKEKNVEREQLKKVKSSHKFIKSVTDIFSHLSFVNFDVIRINVFCHLSLFKSLKVGGETQYYWENHPLPCTNNITGDSRRPPRTVMAT